MTHHALEAFDAAQPAPCVERRPSSTNAQQALFLMNSEFLTERSRDFAARVAAEARSPEERVRRAYLLALGRPPAADEVSDAPLEALCHALLSSNPFLYVD